MRIFANVSGVLLLLLCVLVAGGCESDSANQSAFIQWAEDNAIPLNSVDPDSDSRDLAPLLDIVADKRIVLLGESRHDASEHFRMKHRLIRYLVEEKQFNAIVMEADLAWGIKVNEYINGGEGDAETVLSDGGYWFIWDTEEVLALVNWMRAYNDDPAHENKLTFFGCDIVYPRQSVSKAIEYLEIIDPDIAESYREINLGQELMSDVFWQESMERYAGAPQEEKLEIHQNYAHFLTLFIRNREEFTAQTSEEEYEWAFRHALVAQWGNRMFTLGTDNFVAGGNLRDESMAKNIEWYANTFGDENKLLVWMHNLHIVKNKITINIPNTPVTDESVMVGMILKGRFRDQMMSIGFAYSQANIEGAPAEPASLEYFDGVLAEVEKPLFALDISSVPKDSPSAKWLSQTRKWRAQGGHMECIPGKTYDAVIYTERITKTTPTPRAQEKFERMEQR